MNRHHLPGLLLGLMLTAFTTSTDASAQGASIGLSPRERAVHLLNRATYGPRPEDIDHVEAIGLEAWLGEQMGPPAQDPELAGRLESFPAASMAIEELLAAYPPGQILQPLRQQLQEGSMSDEDRQAVRRQLAELGPNRILADLVGARLTRAVYSERQLEEVMTAFWFDHFNVFFGKGAVRWLIGDYERTAIRPYVFGRFEDMVLATARHPAMLFYLDNFRSVAPDSSLRAQRRRRMARRGRQDAEAARRQANRRRAGLNENYARELMELHTLGVDGGYTQDDVVAVARVLTGWTFQPVQRERMMAGRQATLEEGRVVVPDGDYSSAYRYRFRPELHDAGEKVVLGHTFERGGGEEEGVELIRMLARHLSTARHIATQLATRFVADEPPPALVDQLTRVFLESGGDLGVLTRTLFTSPYFYAPDVVSTRTKSPFILVASALRMTGARISDPRPLVRPLRSLGEVPYLAEPPTGYEETSAEWASSGAMLNRMNFAVALVSGRVRGVRIEGRAFMERARTLDSDPLQGMAAMLLPGSDRSDLIERIQADLEANPASSERDVAVREASLLLGSPEFQRH